MITIKSRIKRQPSKTTFNHTRVLRISSDPQGALDDFLPHRVVADEGTVDADRMLAEMRLLPHARGESFPCHGPAVDAYGLVFIGKVSGYRFGLQ